MRHEAADPTARAECSGYGSLFGFLVAGLGIGAVLSVFFAPRSGAETRKWMANKFLDAAEATNTRVHEARLRVHDAVDEGQDKVTAAIAAGRQAFAKTEPAKQAQQAS